MERVLSFCHGCWYCLAVFHSFVSCVVCCCLPPDYDFGNDETLYASQFAGGGNGYPYDAVNDDAYHAPRGYSQQQPLPRFSQHGSVAYAHPQHMQQNTSGSSHMQYAHPPPQHHVSYDVHHSHAAASSGPASGPVRRQPPATAWVNGGGGLGVGLGLGMGVGDGLALGTGPVGRGGGDRERERVFSFEPLYPGHAPPLGTNLIEPLSPVASLPVDDEQTWLKKRTELEELMVSLHSDLLFRLQAQQETVDSLLQVKHERDFYLTKLVQLEALCVARSPSESGSRLVNELLTILLEPSSLWLSGDTDHDHIVGSVPIGSAATARSSAPLRRRDDTGNVQIIKY